MASTETEIQLKLGSPQPRTVPAEVIDGLRSIEVVQGDSCPSGFQLAFESDRYDRKKGGAAKDYVLLDSGLLDPMTRVWVGVAVNGSPQPLVDGFIVHQALAVDGDERTRLTVTGEDASIKMDLFEISVEYPSLTDDQIASQILGKYQGLGITSQVEKPTGSSAPQSFVPQQNATDRFQLQMLAARHAFVFYLQPGTAAGQSTAYWGPPKTTGDEQPALTTNMGPANNVESLDLRYHTLDPTLTYGAVLDLEQDPAQTVPVAISAAVQKPGLSKQGAIDSTFGSLAQTPTTFTGKLATLNVRGSLWLDQGLDAGRTQSGAQAKTDRSVKSVVTVRGELNVADYGSVLTAPGLVELRGVGGRYDGLYYVQQVTHRISLEHGQWSYAQSFVLSRGGLGSTISEVDTA